MVLCLRHLVLAPPWWGHSHILIFLCTNKALFLKRKCLADAESDVESWDEEGTLGLEECLFCPHIASSLEANTSHMTAKHSFFLPDAEFICDLEGLVVYLGDYYCTCNIRRLYTGQHSHDNSILLYHYLPSAPCSGELWMQNLKVPSDENTELKGSPFQAWSRSVYCSACYAYCQGVLPC